MQDALVVVLAVVTGLLLLVLLAGLTAALFALGERWWETLHTDEPSHRS